MGGPGAEVLHDKVIGSFQGHAAEPSACSALRVAPKRCRRLGVDDRTGCCWLWLVEAKSIRKVPLSLTALSKTMRLSRVSG